MGIFQCPLSFINNSSEESDSNSYSHSAPTSLNNSLSSQPSLPSVPSLTQPTSSQSSTTHNHCIATLKGHTSSVFSLALSGKHLYSGSSDSEIRVWIQNPSTTTQNINYKFATCHSAVKSLVVLNDKLFTAHNDHKIRVWKINDHNDKHAPHKCIATLPTLNDRVKTLLSSKNYIKVRRHKTCTWVHHVDAISALAFSKDGTLLYSVSWDRTFKVWRTSDYKCLESTWNAHDDAINAIALSEDGFVYTGSADKKIKVWKKISSLGDNKKHELVDTLEKHKSSVNALALSEDGRVLYSGACDRSIIVWEKELVGSGVGVGHMVVVGALRGHEKAILCIKVVGDLVCSGSADKTIRVWKRGMEKSTYWCLGVFQGHRGPVKCLTAAVDTCTSGSSSGTQGGKFYLLYSGSLDHDIKVWRVWVPS